jgi:hypothetical protein
MLSLLLLSVTLVTAITLECHDVLDLQLLLYRICLLSRSCTEKYKLEPHLQVLPQTLDLGFYGTLNETGSRQGHDVQKFLQQTHGTLLFPLQQQSVSASASETLSTATLVQLAHSDQVLRLNGSRQHTLSIHINRSQQWLCSNTHGTAERVDASLENRLLFFELLYALESYKDLVADDMPCSDFNERLVMTTDRQFHCICKPGKSCNNSDRYHTILIVLLVVLCVLVLIWILSQLLTLRTVRRLVNNNGNKRL